MSDNKNNKQKEFRKNFGKYDLVIDKGKIITVLVIVIAMILFTLFMFYLSGVFK